tara:strand:+ start:198 stop:302 length:105 start_codon:yes stop_codon:yes gene_type:complete
MRAQRKNCRVSDQFGAAVQQKDPSFTRAAAMIFD